VLPVYAGMGSLSTYAQQVEALNHKTALPAPEVSHLAHGEITLTLEPNALALIRVGGR